MTSSFAQLKKSRSSQFDKLTEEAKKLSGNTPTKSGADDRFWKPVVDKSGNGSAIIRFLPAPQGEDVPFVRLWDHGFQGPGGWYIENSLTTLGQDDPVSEYNSRLWNSGNDKDKEIARKQKRRLHYISNIYVLKDPANPENEGKVFLFKYGKKIFDMLNSAMHPEFEDENAINPFDLWEGANFRLRMRNVEGYRNYDKSSFDEPSVPMVDEDELEKIWLSEYALQEFLDPKNFKSYEELSAKLTRVLGAPGGSQTSSAEDIPEVEYTAPVAESKSAASSTPSFDDDDDSLQFFKQLAAD
jgi:hypothetical protein